ncbi:hypothetical protein THAOC_30239, partial [Thalassiosira oceanica]
MSTPSFLTHGRAQWSSERRRGIKRSVRSSLAALAATVAVRYVAFRLPRDDRWLPAAASSQSSHRKMCSRPRGGNAGGAMCSVVLLGCGCPKRSMGWYHATQILDETRGIGATLDHVVEPWYLSEKAIGAPGSKEFAQFKSYLENKGVKFTPKPK